MGLCSTVTRFFFVLYFVVIAADIISRHDFKVEEFQGEMQQAASSFTGATGLQIKQQHMGLLFQYSRQILLSVAYSYLVLSILYLSVPCFGFLLALLHVLYTLVKFNVFSFTL